MKKQGKTLSGRKILPRFWPEIEREKRQRHYIVTVPEKRIRKINIFPSTGGPLVFSKNCVKKLCTELKRRTELFPCEIFTKINFYIIRDTSKSLRHDVTTIIISTFY